MPGRTAVGDRLSSLPPSYVDVALRARTARVGRLLTYRVPAAWSVRPGQAVWVPLRTRADVGIVARVGVPAPVFVTRCLLATLGTAPVLSARQLALAEWLAERYACSLAEALSGFLPPDTRAGPRLRPAASVDALAGRPAGREFLALLGKRQTISLEAAATALTAPVVAELLAAGLLVVDVPNALPRALRWDPPLLPPERSRLTPAQAQACAAINEAIEARVGRSFLLHGVTGSGKTHVYLHAARRAVERGHQVLILVSDISLAPAMQQRFEQWFPGLVAVVHSELAASERAAARARLLSGDARVVVGARSALFAPLEDLALIVVDEEHDGAYKQQDRAPCYHARELALQLGARAGAAVVLGSATPDVSTYHLATQGAHHLLRLSDRYTESATACSPGADRRAPTALTAPSRGGARVRAVELPTVQIVDLRAELAAGNTSIFSRALVHGLTGTLASGNQAILFLNRRGMATCVTCRDCGHTVMCANCALPLIYHADLEVLLCHHCNARRRTPERCPGCGGRRIRYLGAGTQRVAEEVRRRFPDVRLLRWDRDTAGQRGAHARLWEAFHRGDADVLVGTQMVAKGFDFPRVTLVGVVLADASLHLPDFRAAERAFQLLTQVAGRAGRGSRPGAVVLQTYSPQHYAVQAARRHDYVAFAERELAFRRAHAYPPFRRLARLTYSDPSETRCWRECGHVARWLRARASTLGAHAQVLGPAPAYLRRLRGRYRWQILLAASAPERLLAGHGLTAGWTVDVDPDSLL